MSFYNDRDKSRNEIAKKFPMRKEKVLSRFLTRLRGKSAARHFAGFLLHSPGMEVVSSRRSRMKKSTGHTMDENCPKKSMSHVMFDCQVNPYPCYGFLAKLISVNNKDILLDIKGILHWKMLCFMKNWILNDFEDAYKKTTKCLGIQASI